MPAPLLQIENLSCERDDRLLFSNLNFALAAGEVLQIEGGNGAGKTTLLRIVAGLSSHFDGAVYWRGERVSSRFLSSSTTEYRAQLQYLGHQPGVKGGLSPRQNLQWSMALCGVPCSEQDCDQALHRVGLYGYEDVACARLSAGQHRRVALARLYLSVATLWILDEPFTAIDRQGIAQLEALLAAHLQRGGCVLLTSHQPLGLSVPQRSLSLPSGSLL